MFVWGEEWWYIFSNEDLAVEHVPTWRQYALCKEYPDFGWTDSGASKWLRNRVFVCRSCPVATLCLISGITEPVGIWGGFSISGRKSLRMAIHRKDFRWFRRIVRNCGCRLNVAATATAVWVRSKNKTSDISPYREMFEEDKDNASDFTKAVARNIFRHPDSE